MDKEIEKYKALSIVFPVTCRDTVITLGNAKLGGLERAVSNYVAMSCRITYISGARVSNLIVLQNDENRIFSVEPFF